MAKKISITKNETAEMAVIKLLKCKDDDVILVIPNFSQLANSLENFRLLKKEADEAEKNVLIESVDDVVIELAKRADLDANNPFFSSNSKKNFKSLEPDANENLPPVEISLDEIKEDIGESVKKISGLKGQLIVLVVMLLVLLPGSYIAYKVLPQAKVKIVTQKLKWDYKDNLTIDKSLATVDLVLGKIPGQIFNEKKNGQLNYPATGKKKLSKKATVAAVLYNNYSSAPQSLVASTRLETSDGKIFRLTDSVIIPGAKVSGGRVTPSSISAKAVADRSGPDYNIGPVAKFTIPGFKHTAKYDGFYAVSTENASGGFIGEAAYPTDEDIKQAKTKSAVTLVDGLKVLIKNKLPEGFKIVIGSEKFTVNKQIINTDVNEKNEFSIFVDAEMSIMAFRESDVNIVLFDKIKKELSVNLKPITSTLTYGDAKWDFTKGTMTLPITYKSQLEYPLDKEKLKEQLVGKSEVELKAMLFATPGLTSANVSFWPFWVNHVPEKVTVEEASEAVPAVDNKTK